MFGENPIMKKDKTDGETLRVVDGESFYTIQGEGIFSGRPATFIRLHGCNLKCWFCDTQFSNEEDPDIPISYLVDQCLENKAKLVVITGGEPLRQPIAPLIRQLLNKDLTVQLETSGSLWREEMAEFDGYDIHYIVSPKTGKVNPKIADRAAAYKYIINAEETCPEDGLPLFSTQAKFKPLRIARPPEGMKIYISPCDVYDDAKNKVNTELVGKLSLKHGYTAQVQVHKYLGLA